MSSRLNLLMKELEIKGKELSQLMNIDSTLVSKWRSGKRMLKTKSLYAEQIVSIFMERDEPNQYNNICNLLQNDYENIYSCSAKEISLFLKMWLTFGNITSHQVIKFGQLKDMNLVDMSIFYKFHGNKGRRQALRFMMDYAFTQSPGIERLSYTEESADWFNEDQAFLTEWREKNCLFLNSGNKIEVIHPVDRTYKTTAVSMLGWMPLHMTGQTQAFYIPRYMEETIGFTIFLIPRQLVIFSLSSKTHSKRITTYLTNDSTFLESIGNVLQDFFNRSVPIFKRYNFITNEDFYNDLIGILEAKKAKYIYCSTFLFMPLTESLIREILKYNCVSEEDVDKIARQHNKISALSGCSLNKYFINLEKVREKLKQDSVVLDSFSFIMGTRISVPKELFAKIVCEAADSFKKSDNVEIGIVDSKVLADLGDINIFTQEDTCANFLCSDLEKPLSLMTKELAVAMGMVLFLGNIWESIPRLKRNKKFVYKQLKELLSIAINGNG